MPGIDVIRRVCRVLGLILLAGFLRAQSVPGSFRSLSVREGLSEGQNAFITKDSRGFVWISSVSGLNRFDGRRVRIWTEDKTDPAGLLGDNVQSAFYEDARGQLWFSTFEAIHRYDWQRDCFDHYQLTDSLGRPMAGYMAFHLDEAGRLWFATFVYGVFTLDTETGEFAFVGEPAIRPNRATAAHHPDGRIRRWIGYNTTNGALCIHDRHGGADPVATAILTHHPQVDKERLYCVLPESDSVLWLLWEGHLGRYRWDDARLDLWNIHPAQSIAHYGHGKLLISYDDGRLGVLEKSGLSTEQLDIPPPVPVPGQPEYRFDAMYTDPDGGIWGGVFRRGVYYTYPGKQKFHKFLLPATDEARDLVVPVSLIEEAPGLLRCFTRNHGMFLLRHDPQHGVRIVAAGLGSPDITQEVLMASRYGQGRYGIATVTGARVYDPSTGEEFTPDNDNGSCMWLEASGPDEFVLSPNVFGIRRLVPNGAGGYRLDPISGFNQSLGYYPVFSDLQGRIWAREALLRFLVQDTADASILGTLVMRGDFRDTWFAPDSASIWMALSSGLYEVDARTLGVRNHYYAGHGLPASDVKSITPDHRGRLWLPYHDHLAVLDPATGTFRSFDAADGLPVTEFTAASARMADGSVWLGYAGGLVHFHPDSIRTIRIRAIPQITDWLINDRPPAASIACQATGSTHITEIRRLKLSHRESSLAFRVNALEYSAPEQCRVSYQLTGVDAAPVDVASGSLVRYPNLPAGSYALKVFAYNSDGVPNPVPRTISITITPPFYKTFWFVALSVLLALGILGYIVYLRVSKALELQKVRLKLYENLHDDVGSRLTAIVLSAEELSRQSNVQHPKLDMIAGIAKNIVGNMRRLVWAIDPENDRMESIVQRINHDRSGILPDGTDFALEVSPRLRQRVIPGEIRYQILSICNEAFTNIAKYAEAKTVRVEIAERPRALVLTIADDGRGFDPAGKTRDTVSGSGYGLSNMRRRASRVGGTFRLESTPGSGTRIEVVFPV